MHVCKCPRQIKKEKKNAIITRKHQHQRRRQRDVLPFASRGRSSGVDDLLEDFTYSSSSFSSFISFIFTIIVVVSYAFLAFGIHNGKRTRPMECLRGKKLIFFFCRDAEGTQRGNRRRRRKARSSMDDEQRFETRVTTTVQSSSLERRRRPRRRRVVCKKKIGLAFLLLLNGLIFFSPSKNEKKRVPL